MKFDPTIVCVGDLFLEYLAKDVPPGTTTVIEGRRRELGGTAFNICWYLSHFGIRPRLVAPFSWLERKCLGAAAEDVRLSDVLWTHGPADTLIVFSNGIGHRAVYVRTDLPSDTDERLMNVCGPARQIILAGSRHPVIRRVFVALTRDRGARNLVFSPSYAIYEFTRTELRDLFGGVNLVILNQAEARFACTQLGCRGLRALAKRVSDTLIVTLADRGAELYGPSGNLAIGSLSGLKGDVIGTGDAFLAGYLCEMARGSPSHIALHFASEIAAQVARTGKVRAPVDVSSARRLLGSNRRRSNVMSRRPN